MALKHAVGGALAAKGASCAAMIALAVAVASPVCAQSTVSGNAFGHAPGSAIGLSDTNSNSAPLGAPNAITINAASPLLGLTFSGSTAVATFQGQSGSGYGSLMSAMVQGDIITGGFGGSGDANAIATVSSTDRLIILGTPSDHREVTLHKTLNLQRGSFTTIDPIVTGLIGGDGAFSATAQTLLRIGSEEIGPGPLGGLIFAEQSYVADKDHSALMSSGAPSTIDFSLNFFLGEAQRFDITMQLLGEEELDITALGPAGRMVFSQDYGLSWMDGATITDAATGEALCGLTVTADSGFDYLGRANTGACGGGSAGGVPEPASWALMIVGFGLTGAALRRRRGSTCMAIGDL